MKMYAYKFVIIISSLVSVLALSMAESTATIDEPIFDGPILIDGAITSAAAVSVCPVESYTNASILMTISGKILRVVQCSCDSDCGGKAKCCPGSPAPGGRNALKCIQPEMVLTACQHKEKVLSNIKNILDALMTDATGITVTQLRDALSVCAVKDHLSYLGFDIGQIKKEIDAATDSTTAVDILTEVRSYMTNNFTRCDINGKYAALQCQQRLDSEKGECFCVDQETGERRLDIVASGDKSPDCPGLYVETDITGRCPNPGNTSETVRNLMLNDCFIQCDRNADCSLGEICCPDRCNTACKPPVRHDRTPCESELYQYEMVMKSFQSMLTITDIKLGDFIDQLERFPSLRDLYQRNIWRYMRMLPEERKQHINASISEAMLKLVGDISYSKPTCDSDGNFVRQCTVSLVGTDEVCLEIETKDKEPVVSGHPGFCPVRSYTESSLMAIVAERCTADDQCSSDNNCTRPYKCCAEPGGSCLKCMEPETNLTKCQHVRRVMSNINQTLAKLIAEGKNVTVRQLRKALSRPAVSKIIAYTGFDPAMLHRELSNGLFDNITIAAIIPLIKQQLIIPIPVCDMAGGYERRQCKQHLDGTVANCSCADPETGNHYGRTAPFPELQCSDMPDVSYPFKAGLCPHPGNITEALYKLTADPSSCTISCAMDVDCNEDRKCCIVGCDTTCLPPIKKDSSKCEVTQYQETMPREYFQAMMTINNVTLGAYVNRIKGLPWPNISQIGSELTKLEPYYNSSLGQYMLDLSKNVSYPHTTCDKDGHFDSVQCYAYMNGTRNGCVCADPKTGITIPSKNTRQTTPPHCPVTTPRQRSDSEVCPYPGNSMDALYKLMANPTSCMVNCTMDSQCGDGQKCCTVGCNYQCTQSLKLNMTLCEEKQYLYRMLNMSAAEISTIHNVTFGAFVNSTMEVPGLRNLLGQFGIDLNNYKPYQQEYFNMSIGDVLANISEHMSFPAADCYMDGNFETVQCTRYLNGKEVDCYCVDPKTGEKESDHMTVWPERPSCGVCPRGQPIPNVYCGRGPTHQDCPETHECRIDSSDRWAVCCPDDPSSPEYMCELGKEFIPKKKECEHCRRGFYRDNHGQHSCVPCLMRSTTRGKGAQNRTECIIIDTCELGEEFVPSSGGCELCRRGSYRDKLAPAQVECKRCPNGRNTPETGAQNKAACTIDACRPGQESHDSPKDDDAHESVQTCRPCPQGFYRDKLNESQVACVPCPEGKSTPSPGASSKRDCTVVACNPGSEFIDTSGNCTLCRRGFYRDNKTPVHEGCKRCPSHKSTSATGAINKHNCSIECKKLRCADGCDITSIDGAGCQTCDCLNPCKAVSCRPGEWCSSDKTGKASCLKYCPRVKCEKSCKGGKKKDKRDCDTCECYKPCEDHPCLLGQMCVEVGNIAICRQEKLGECPPRYEVSGRCENRCDGQDNNCRGTTKCCPNSCGTSCTSPESAGTCEKALKEAYKKMQQKPSAVISWPRCTLPGGTWNSTQVNDALGMSWCVDSEGTLKENTTRRGMADCSRDPGTLQDEEVCPDGEKIFQCNPDKCLSAYCPADPAALCRVNPCGGCKPDFYNSTNDVVDCTNDISDCENKLKMYMEKEAKESGRIKGLIQRCIAEQLDHNVECDPKPEVPWPKITGGGMSDVSSRFPILDLCVLQPDPETCSGNRPMWFYNTTLGECALFEYSCDGNANRFKDQATCQQFCSREVNNATMMQGGFQPRCRDAIYDYKQCHSGYCWCVNETGEMRDGTITRGSLFCNAKGVRNGTDFIPTVCQDGGTPLACTTACTDSVCDRHPDATCYADPCNNCEVTYQGPAGNTVNCSASPAMMDPCEEPLDTGDSECKRQSTRWHYNNDEKKCQKFSYSGCGSNRNNFRRKRDCEKECVKMQEIELPTCGQDGRRPKVNCPGNVCKDQTCSRFPEIRCQVDSCTCLPVFKDPRTDEEIDCGRLATLCQRDIATAELMDELEDFVPECNERGEYRPTQCSSTHCWCVNGDGTERASTRVNYTTEKLNCTMILVKKVRLTFSFNIAFSRVSGKLRSFKVVIRNKIGSLLNAPDVVADIEVTPGSIVVAATLENTNTTDPVDISSCADLIMRKGSRGNLRVDFDGTSFTANGSTFQAEPSYAPLQQEEVTTTGTPAQTVGSTQAPETAEDGPPLGIIIPCVVAAVVIIAIIAIVCYNKRKGANKQMERQKTYAERTPHADYVSPNPFQADADKHFYNATERDNPAMTHDPDDKPRAGERPTYLSVKL